MRTLSKTPDIEPLSTEAWKRVEKGLFDALDRPENAPLPTSSRTTATGWRRPALAAGLLAAAAILVAMAIRPGPRLPDGSGALTRIETAEAPVELMIAGSKITFAPHSAALYGNANGTVQVVLQSGGVHCKVTPRKSGERFLVHAADVQVSVVGTEFEVTRDGQDVSISVQEGQVQVCRGADCSLVGPGATWPPAVAAVPVMPARAATAPRPAKKKRHKKAVSIWQTRFYKAQELEASDPEAAIAHYEDVAAGPDETWSALSTYALGLLHAQRGDTTKARKWWNLYLEQYPDGPNATDVRADLSRL